MKLIIAHLLSEEIEQLMENSIKYTKQNKIYIFMRENFESLFKEIYKIVYSLYDNKYSSELIHSKLHFVTNFILLVSEKVPRQRMKN